MIGRFICMGAIALSILTATQATAADDRARLTVGMPVYVTHPDDRPGGEDWNEGWFHNEGALVDVTWPVWSLGESTTVRLGGTAGAFDNSVFDTSVFVGGVGEIETHATKDLAFSLGTYLGAISGYDDGIDPAIAPYVGTSYAITERLEVGARGFWLPAKTIAGPAFADSDAYIGVVTIGTRF